MPQNKRIIFSEELQAQARFAQVMCHPARIEIFKLLNQYEFLLCSEFVDFLPYTQTGVSHHLEVMLCAKLIARVQKFDTVGYSLDINGCSLAKESLQKLISIL